MSPLAEPSPNGGRIDLGFYGGTSQASKSLSGGCYKIADLTNDHSVDVADLFWFAQFWLENNLFSPADLNRDQRVNLHDFGTLSQSWMQ
jgi:hypothetical protein